MFLCKDGQTWKDTGKQKLFRKPMEVISLVCDELAASGQFNSVTMDQPDKQYAFKKLLKKKRCEK